MRLTPVSERPDAVGVLWDLLAERKPCQSISHRRMPTREEHAAFVASQPYQAWYLIDDGHDTVGAVYLTRADEIGVSIFERFQGRGFGSSAVLMLMGLHGKRRYLANVNPENEKSAAMWRKLGLTHVQDTYALED